jgi:hypothetical protein
MTAPDVTEQRQARGYVLVRVGAFEVEEAV